MERSFMPRRNMRCSNGKRSFSLKRRVLRTFKDLTEILPAIQRLAFELFLTLAFLYTLYRIAVWL
jgi:hypothetical protein